MPSEIVAVSSCNIHTLDDEINDNFKYMSSQNVVGDRKDRRKHHSKTSRSRTITK